MIRRDILINLLIALVGVFIGGAIAARLASVSGSGAISTVCFASATVALVILLRLLLSTPTKALPVPLPVAMQVNVPVTATDPRHPEREFLPPEVTPDVLRSKVKGRTSVQVRAIASTFSGKWMRVIGPVRDIAQATDEIWILFGGAAPDYTNQFSARFFKNDFEKLMALNVGDVVTIVGRIETLSSDVGLSDCEIENIDRAALGQQ